MIENPVPILKQILLVLEDILRQLKKS